MPDSSADLPKQKEIEIKVKKGLPGGVMSSGRWIRKQFQDNSTGVISNYVLDSINGVLFSFQDGEEFVELLQDENMRLPFVHLGNGAIVSFESWKSGQRVDRKQILDQADPLFRELFVVALEDYPQLGIVDIIAATKEEFPSLEYTGGLWIRPSGENPNPSMAVNIKSEKHYEKLIREREISARAAAKSIGIDFEVLKQHPDILARFIFLHEVGHIYDYIVNYQNNPKNGVDKTYDPIKANHSVRTLEMDSLPYPGKNPAFTRHQLLIGELEIVYDKYRVFYQSIGINSVEELYTSQEVAYRNLPSEKFADNFAGHVLRTYWQGLGLDKKTAVKINT